MTTVKFDATQGVGYVLDGEGDFDESAHPRDEKGQFTVVASGNTFERKEKLKAEGFRWHGESKTWRKEVELTRTEFERAHISSKTVPEHEQAAQSALRQKLAGKAYLKDLELHLVNRLADWRAAHSQSKIIHTGSEIQAKREAKREAEQKTPDRTERNRAMHEALGHSGYMHIPGSAPDDLH